MPSTMTYSRGDVVVASLQFTDQVGRKTRPVLVVSSNQYNQAQNDVIVAQISSYKGHPMHIGDHLIAEWPQAGLLSPSVVRAKVFTIQKSRVTKHLGRMHSDDFQAVEDSLRQVLQL